MEEVKQLLTGAGVIGDIVDDFDPLFKLDVIYRDKRISLGDHVSPDQVQHRPHHFEYFYESANTQLPESVIHAPSMAMVMTDLDADGGEYLNWLCVNVNPRQELLVLPPTILAPILWYDLLDYEAPRERRMSTRKIVFTLFTTANVPHRIMLPQSRKNFSTRLFADTNALGPPLAAAFLKIIDPNEKTKEEVKQLLTEAGVIGGILGDFDPEFQLDLLYSSTHFGDQRICLGDEVSRYQLNHRPSSLDYIHDLDHPELLDNFMEPALLTIVMTDPDAPGGEYLHWLCRQFIVAEQEEDNPSEELVSYEAPREGTRKIVCTVFRPNESQPNTNIGMTFPNIVIPESRNNFSTRDFASTHALGPPLATTFVKINNRHLANCLLQFLPTG